MTNTLALTFDGEFPSAAMPAILAPYAADPDFFILQIGAMDGVSFDPIHDALVQHNWPALLLEPQPEFFALLQKNYSASPRVRCVCRAIAEHSGETVLYRVPPERVLDGTVRPWLGGIASLYRDRNAIGGNAVPVETAQLINQLLTTQAVPCSTLPDLIAEQGLTRIDMLMIDAEGGDWMILRQLDVERFAPKLIYFEFINLPNDERGAAMAFLTGHGYRVLISDQRTDVLAVKR